MGMPLALPKEAESFRIVIDDSGHRHSHRLITSEWMSASRFTSQFMEDFVPKLQRAGNVSFIACNAHHEDADSGRRPNIYWHWNGSEWKAP